VVALGPEADAGLDDVVGLGATEDLTRDVGQGGVDPVTLGPGLDPALLGVGEDHVVGAVTVAHRCPLYGKESTKFSVRPDRSRDVTRCLGVGEKAA